METIQSISDVIDKLVESNTLSGAGVKAMEALRVRVIEQEKQLAGMQSEANKLALRVDSLGGELARCRAINATWTNREAALIKREAEVTKLELESAVAIGKTEVVRECFALVFRNAEIRETLRSTTPVVYPAPGGGPGYASVHETRNEVTRQQT